MGSRKLMEHTLLSEVTGTSTGTWVDVTSWNRISVQVVGITTATLQLWGYCGPTKPSDAVETDCTQIGANITADGYVTVTHKVKWIKMKISAHTTGTISAYAIGDTTAYGA